MESVARVESVARILFGRWIDYAGRFPPASKSLADVVDDFLAYARSDRRWFLRRLVLAESEWSELSAILNDASPPAVRRSSDPIDVSLVVGSDWEAVGRSERTVELGAPARCVAVEGRWTDAAAWSDIAAWAAGRTVYVELEPDQVDRCRLEVLRRHGLAAKFRCGGVRAEMFPPPAALGRFMAACHRAGVPYKLTAGLHHLERGSYPLTYEPDAPSGMMFGFLGVAVAGLLLAEAPEEIESAEIESAEIESAMEAILECSRRDVSLTPERIGWRGRSWDAAACKRVRDLFHSVGSCSFDEPFAELNAWVST